LAILSLGRESLKEQLTEALGSLKTFNTKVDMAINKMEERAKNLLEQAAACYAKGDKTKAMMLASEIALIRNLSQKLTKSSLALEVVQLRIETVITSGDIVTTLQPAIEAIKSVKDDIGSLIPGADEQLGKLNDALGDVLANSFHMDVKSIDSLLKTSSADEVLAEVMSIVANEQSTQLPTPPANTAENPMQEST